MKETGTDGDTPALEERNKSDFIFKSFLESIYAQIEELTKNIDVNISYSTDLSSQTDAADMYNENVEALRKQCQAVIEAITLSFDAYFLQFIQVIQNQIQLLVESWKYKANRGSYYLKQKKQVNKSMCADLNVNSMSLIINPHKLNFLVSKIIKIRRRRLHDELADKIDKIKLIIGNAIDSRASVGQHAALEFDLYELIDINHFLCSMEKKKSFFEDVGFSLIERARLFHEQLMQTQENEISSEVEAESVDNYTMSDTEAHIMSKYNSINRKLQIGKLKKWHKENVNKSFSPISNANKKSSLSSFSLLDSHKDCDSCQKQQSLSDSEVDNMSLKDFIPFHSQTGSFSNYDLTSGRQGQLKRKFSKKCVDLLPENSFFQSGNQQQLFDDSQIDSDLSIEDDNEFCEIPSRGGLKAHDNEFLNSFNSEETTSSIFPDQCFSEIALEAHGEVTIKKKNTKKATIQNRGKLFQEAS